MQNSRLNMELGYTFLISYMCEYRHEQLIELSLPVLDHFVILPYRLLVENSKSAFPLAGFALSRCSSVIVIERR